MYQNKTSEHLPTQCVKWPGKARCHWLVSVLFLPSRLMEMDSSKHVNTRARAQNSSGLPQIRLGHHGFWAKSVSWSLQLLGYNIWNIFEKTWKCDLIHFLVTVESHGSGARGRGRTEVCLFTCFSVKAEFWKSWTCKLKFNPSNILKQVSELICSNRGHPWEEQTSSVLFLLGLQQRICRWGQSGSSACQNCLKTLQLFLLLTVNA